MLKIFYHDASGALQESDAFIPNSVIVLLAPTKAERDQVSHALGVHPAYLEEPLDPEERPRLERDDEMLSIILHFPVRMHEPKEPTSSIVSIPYLPRPVALIHLPEHLVIVSPTENDLFLHVLEGRYGPVETFMRTRLTFLIFEAIAQQFNAVLEEIQQSIKRVQRALRAAHRNRELYELLYLGKSLTYFAASLRAMRTIYQHLLTGRDLPIFENDRELLQNALIDLEQAEEVTALRGESLGQLMDAYAAVVHNNVNAVLKILTTLTVVLAIPTMLASLYAMNVSDLPWHDKVWMFPGLLALMIIIGGALVFFFYKKDFLRF